MVFGVAVSSVEPGLSESSARTSRLKGCSLSEGTDPFGEMGRLTLPSNFGKPKIDIVERDGDGQVR